MKDKRYWVGNFCQICKLSNTEICVVCYRGEKEKGADQFELGTAQMCCFTCSHGQEGECCRYPPHPKHGSPQIRVHQVCGEFKA